MAEVHDEVFDAEARAGARAARPMPRSAASESGRSPATVTCTRCRPGRGRHRSQRRGRCRASAASPRRCLGATRSTCRPGDRRSAGRSARRSCRCRPAGRRRVAGVAAASSMRKYVAVERRVLLGPHQAADLHDLLELAQAGGGATGSRSRTTSYSSSRQPPPIPRMNRLPESTWSVDAIFAVSAGLR